ncbi:MAG: hypothetical protein GC152_09305 [Alphaproteobacteria bacterium]|nr:hypothetical protein [Alphaproteobacteria bacterium]
MREAKRQPGWDKQAVNGIAKSHYGSLEAMFEAHGWDKGDKTFGQIAPTLVVKEYGSIESFVTEHPALPMMSERAAILSDPPNVWLTSFYGFAPEDWGMLGFSNSGQRNHFIRETEPGALVVVYAHKSMAPAHQRGMVVGIQQVSHRVNNAKAYMSPAAWIRKETEMEAGDKWNLAVKATRAWRVAPESYMPIEEFAPESYSIPRAQFIGSQGVRLTSTEAKRIFDLTLIETSVFGETPIDAAVAALGSDLLAPSKPGPVSQSGYFCKEAEGPKSLYVLRLNGDADAFLGRSAEGRMIVKVGISKSPISRRDALNAALPAGAYSWEVIISNEAESLAQFANSKLAISAETKIKEHLHRSQQSLGGEFFLAGDEAIRDAWNYAIGGASK